jgi:SWI/SNF-related matrix-associated actin-dependent regulator of chromatin subfamily A-like protein 1
VNNQPYHANIMARGFQPNPQQARPPMLTNTYNNVPYTYYYNSPLSFVLVNTREFTVRAEGSVSSNVVELIKRVPGMRFDSSRNRLLFPLSQHNNLQVALGRMNVFVEPIPKLALAAAMLQNSKDADARGSSAAEAAERVLKQLRTRIHDSLLQALAPFQREGVQFVIKNDGRALIADEMGLGEFHSSSCCILHFPLKYTLMP